MKYRLEIDERIVNRIISVAYGDANPLDKIKIYLLAARNNEIKRLLTEYKITAGSIKNLKNENCPDEILEKIKDHTGMEKKFLFSPVIKFLDALLYKPAAIISAVLILAAGIAFFMLFNKGGRNQYSEKQIQLAEKQVKESLVLVNKIFNRTANKLEYDILREQVVKPVHEGVSTINELFRGG